MTHKGLYCTTFVSSDRSSLRYDVLLYNVHPSACTSIKLKHIYMTLLTLVTLPISMNCMDPSMLDQHSWLHQYLLKANDNYMNNSYNYSLSVSDDFCSVRFGKEN